MAKQIFLIRHGETAWSLSGQHTGQTDLPLTDNGERVATLLRSRLDGMKFSHVLTSPLQRARKTCELAGFGAVAQIDPELHEWDYGDYESRTTAEILAERPGWNIFEDGCPHGESLAQISQRADDVLATISRFDGIVAVFSHGQFLRVLAVRWIGLPVQTGQHFAMDTAAISVLGYDHRNGEITAINHWNSGADIRSFNQ